MKRILEIHQIIEYCSECQYSQLIDKNRPEYSYKHIEINGNATCLVENKNCKGPESVYNIKCRAMNTTVHYGLKMNEIAGFFFDRIEEKHKFAKDTIPELCYRSKVIEE